ncbi:MAG TPA: DUF1800 domain-containing protein [Acidobacteriaceae bacterium]|jgi:uncharacterized protein (DUF1800 family)|nr:DUF1800 domain-containing protein [Acidobacteriaceae bacterium]
MFRLLKAVVAGMLCGLMAAPSVWASGGAAKERKAAPVERIAPLTQQQRVLQALNRFTFGPRPGDEAAVRRMGLERWFEQQLHPESIDDTAFEQRMSEYPAMRLSQEELIERFPSPGMLKRADRQDAPLPSDPVERAIYADAELVYAARLKDVANANAEPATNGAAMNGAAAQTMEMSQTADATAVGKKGKLKPKDLAAPMDADEVQAVLTLGPDARVAKMVAMTPDEMMAFRVGLKPREKQQLVEGLSPEQVEVVGSLIAEPIRVVGAEALETRLMRDVYSERQLQAVMTEFWLNHFNVYVKKNQNEPYLLPGFERDVILPNALGRFEDLSVAVAKSPAMLMYLDNWESVGPDSPAATRARRVQALRANGKIAKARPLGINENYGRELMELHTLGVNGGYTQQDVIAVAKCFTGWTVDRPYQGGEFVFNENRHEPGPKTVLGHVIPEGGENEGLEVLHILATSPATAHFISEELAERFVSDTPPAALVNRMAATFLKTDGDIKAVLRTMFRSPEFWSPQVYRAKVKTPVEFLASALRASDAQVTNALPLVQAMDRLGMPVYGMQTPNGYSWEAEDWVSSNALISRMNFALVLSSNRVPGTRTDWPALLGEESGAESEPDAATEKRLEMLLLGQPATEHTRATVLAEFRNPTAQQSAEEGFRAQSVATEDDGFGGGRLLRTKAGRERAVNAPETPLDTMAGLLLGSPEFQRR